MKDHKELQLELSRLKSERTRLENNIVAGGEKIYESIRHPVPIIKETVASLVSDRTFIINLMTLAFNYFSNKMNGKKTDDSFARSTEGTSKNKEGGFTSRIFDLLSSFIKRR
jgi:hypothetical protein